MPAVFRAFLLVVVFLSAAFLASEWYCRHSATLNHMPYTHFTLDPSDDYADFRMFVVRFQHFHHSDFFSPQWGSPFLYPATVGTLYEPFYAFHLRYVGQRFLAELALCMGLLALWFRRALMRHGLSMPAATIFAFGAALFSYPFYFEFNRGNMEIFIWGFAALGVLAFVRNKPWQAATWIGLAGACKIYPFIYLGLLIARRQYKQAAWALVVGVGFTIFSLWALTGSIALSRTGTAAGLELFRWLYVLHKRPGEIGLDHSIFGFYKRFVPHVPPPDELAHQLSIYLAVIAVIACFIYFVRAIKLPVINQVIFLTVACLVLPPVSYDYTLLHLYTPFLLMVFLAIDFWKRGVELPRSVWAAFICFMLLLAPLNEIIVHGERIAGQLKCLLLLALAFIALRYRFVSNPEPATAEAV
jgi:hypothetical protein